MSQNKRSDGFEITEGGRITFSDHTARRIGLDTGTYMGLTIINLKTGRRSSFFECCVIDHVQVAIPEEVIRDLQLKPGDFVDLCEIMIGRRTRKPTTRESTRSMDK
ncbi:MAG: hypothetical protein HYY22_01965 [Thaumarchaeota archaeon]|nr:hypothetical protein [Nitrososphaerota archaeon]